MSWNETYLKDQIDSLKAENQELKEKLDRQSVDYLVLDNEHEDTKYKLAQLKESLVQPLGEVVLEIRLDEFLDDSREEDEYFGEELGLDMANANYNPYKLIITKLLDEDKEQ